MIWYKQNIFFRSFPKFPPGWKFLNWLLLNPLSSNSAIAIQSPITNINVVELVGAKLCGHASTGFLCPTQWVPDIDKKDPMFGTAAQWNADFIKAHPEYSSVPYQSAQASAAVYVWKEAFEAANSFDKDVVRDAIAGVEMETFYGDVKFGPDGNNIAKPMFLRQIGSDGSYNLVGSFADLAYPRNVTY